MVDVESFEKSMNTMIEDMACAAVAKKMGLQPDDDKVRSMVRLQLKNPAVQAQMKQFTNVDTFLRMVMAEARGAKSGGEEFQEKWESPLTFSLVGAKTGLKVVFRFRGVKGWKLCGMEIGQSDLGKLFGGV
jgi:hypothetical protein